MRQTTARDRRFFQVAAQVIDGLSPVFRLLRQVDVPVLAASGQYQTVPVAFTVDVGQLRRHRQLRKRLSQGSQQNSEKIVR
ncbi:hypothetical protein ALP58_200075 [Pseudomonas savastanoi]|uniref:Uncharacterized protein n=1 Tax=Pseudomonas savastanoi TaxID=29438 RepID=A0A3M5GAP9_PSESS|nr:hypothetical protein ALP58_200075 [Pseudomonas savastanoi]